MSVDDTGAESRRVAVIALSETSITIGAVPSVTWTMNAPPSGAESSFSASLQVRVSSLRFTDAPVGVGRTPSTRCPGSAGTAGWVSTASSVLSVEAVIVPPLRVRRLAAMAMPSASSSSSTTW